MHKKENKTSQFGINELYLSGFQVFDELTHIPLRRLTFLYGPNSAGKSAVEDALMIIGEMCRPKAFDVDRQNRAPRLSKHWRRISESIDGLSDSMIIGIKARLPQCRWHVEMDGKLQFAFPEGSPYKYGSRESAASQKPEIDIEYRVTFSIEQRQTTVRSERIEINRSIELFLDGKIAIWLSDGRFGVNFLNPYLRGLDSKFGQNKHFRTVKSSYFSQVNDGKIELNGLAYLDDDRLLYRGAMQGVYENAADCVMGVVSEDAEFIEHRHRVDEEASIASEIFPHIAEVFDCVVRTVLPRLGSFLSEARTTVVPASRTIPTDRNLTFLFDAKENNSGAFRLHNKEFPLAFGVISEGDDSPYYWLARSIYTPMTALGSRLERTYEVNGGHLKKINRMMIDHLFIEQGYRIDFDFRVILDPAEFDNLGVDGISSKPKLPGDYSMLMRIFLADSKGREFSFSDVGSGLGYILPVLVSICDPIKRLLIVQQPELHLHPALQSELGDIFIDASDHELAKISEQNSDEWNKQLIVETHSEHIMLRVLRRIRQSHVGRSAENLNIFADEVSVVYFDPQPNGTTKVKSLPISDDGEFLARWPRGFFTERDADLFDDE